MIHPSDGRLLIAGQIMGGLLTHAAPFSSYLKEERQGRVVARLALQLADTLIEEANRESGK